MLCKLAGSPSCTLVETYFDLPLGAMRQIFFSFSQEHCNSLRGFRALYFFLCLLLHPAEKRQAGLLCHDVLCQTTLKRWGLETMDQNPWSGEQGKHCPLSNQLPHFISAMIGKLMITAYSGTRAPRNWSLIKIGPTPEPHRKRPRHFKQTWVQKESILSKNKGEFLIDTEASRKRRSLANQHKIYDQSK